MLKEFGFVAATHEVATSLRLEEGAPVLRVVRLRVKGSLPLVHSTLFLPESIGRLLTAKDFRAHPLSELLARSGHRYSKIDIVTRARLATPTIAKSPLRRLNS